MVERNERKERIGIVVSDKMNKSIVAETQSKPEDGNGKSVNQVRIPGREIYYIQKKSKRT